MKTSQALQLAIDLHREKSQLEMFVRCGLGNASCAWIARRKIARLERKLNRK